eukprot:CAMPEP_0183295370 /NCGR_PEP_ID=MMETSP0160_2-20130417/3354_1 /TAXON_ID=2839 ORGANISM="Odontella Sinensis, Strain Grunow 1884" /NCGR_SAMPLE_ID=MMETSP0160_2 /ASSEMBLY_ACC=CAM_ASM_000250 /LENGTH=325 /DNA_ID=CAMNT_0025456849 /DNA_START=21 /DNA_END=998 /DNA_ORIENTATION=-
MACRRLSSCRGRGGAPERTPFPALPAILLLVIAVVTADRPLAPQRPSFGRFRAPSSATANAGAAFASRPTASRLSSPPFRRTAAASPRPLIRTIASGPLASTSPSAAFDFDFADADDEPRWRAEATDIIRSAAVAAGADETKLSIEWKPGSLIVTVGGEIGIGGSAASDEEEEDAVLYEDDDLGLYEDEEDDEVYGDEEEEEEEGPSITSIARAINSALYEDSEEHGELSVGNHVATTHEIEVTTPGASDVLEGEVMFEAYRGFDVIVETNETNKKGKKRVVEGKLVERDDDFTRVNVKGRIVKVKNANIECVRLPKAKREKGAR